MDIIRFSLLNQSLEQTLLAPDHSLVILLSIMQEIKQESGLSSRIRSKGPPKPQTPEDDSLDQKKYTFYLDVVIPDKVDTPKTEISVPNNMKVYDAVKLALQRFKLELELLGVAVGQNVDLYNPRLSKKNGKAKMDMPSLDFDQILSEIRIKGVSLQLKEESAVRVISVGVGAVLAPIMESEEFIRNQIGYERREKKEIASNIDEEKPAKPESGCFFSFC